MSLTCAHFVSLVPRTIRSLISTRWREGSAASPRRRTCLCVNARVYAPIIIYQCRIRSEGRRWTRTAPFLGAFYYSMYLDVFSSPCPFLPFHPQPPREARIKRIAKTGAFPGYIMCTTVKRRLYSATTSYLDSICIGRFWRLNLTVNYTDPEPCFERASISLGDIDRITRRIDRWNRRALFELMSRDIASSTLRVGRTRGKKPIFEEL